MTTKKIIISKAIETLFGKIVIMTVMKIEKFGFMIMKQKRKNIYISSIMSLVNEVFIRLLKIQVNTLIQLKLLMMILQLKAEILLNLYQHNLL